MNYETMSAKDFREAGASRKESIYAKTAYVGSIKSQEIFEEEYQRLCEDASTGDAVAMDILAEWFRNGNQVVRENIDTSMQWLILAGANGNKFSLDRLKIHFGFAFDAIVDLKEFPQIAQKCDIDSSNYQYLLGEMLCKAVVEDMKIDALKLAQLNPTYLPFSAVVLRSFDRSITKAIEIVSEQLKKFA